MGCPYPSSMALSMDSGEATPSSTIRMASSPRATPRRDVANPGESRTTMASLPIFRTTPRAVSTAASQLVAARTTSTSLMRCGGLKKWSPTTRSGREAARARRVTLREEVLEASSALSRQSPPRFLKRASFSARISGMASTTRSASCETSSRVSETASRERTAPIDSLATLPRATPCSSVSRIDSKADLALPGWASNRRTLYPAMAAT